MKILHSADWHLDSPLLGRSPEQTEDLRSALLELPHKVAAAAKAEVCDLMLLAGDLFDGPYSPESLSALRSALEEVQIPVFIAPGNHDYYAPASPWLRESWPRNVHIFTGSAMESVSLPELDCRVYGAAFLTADSPALLADFRAEHSEKYAVGVLHGDPTQVRSPYNAVTAEQVRICGLDYLALGHIHKGGSFRSGQTLCAWPGCPMGRGFDELGEKGVLIVTLADTAETRFLPLDTPRFYDLETEAGNDPAAALSHLLPPVGNRHFYRIALTGECAGVDAQALSAAFSHFPNLELRDRTVPPMDLWAAAGDDTLEGVYFGLLQRSLEGADPRTQYRIQLAAKLSRKILDGQEVRLP